MPQLKQINKQVVTIGSEHNLTAWKMTKLLHVKIKINLTRTTYTTINTVKKLTVNLLKNVKHSTNLKSGKISSKNSYI